VATKYERKRSFLTRNLYGKPLVLTILHQIPTDLTARINGGESLPARG